MSSFISILERYSWEQISLKFKEIRFEDVEQVLAKSERLDIDDFLVLISPAASGFLEPMAQRSLELTRQRFGHSIQLYAPIYVSNECSNMCTYCGFSMEQK